MHSVSTQLAEYNENILLYSFFLRYTVFLTKCMSVHTIHYGNMIHHEKREQQKMISTCITKKSVYNTYTSLSESQWKRKRNKSVTFTLNILCIAIPVS
jgi:hypothetical protein